MKALATWLLLVSMVLADARPRPTVRPYYKMVYLPWLKIPYANCPFRVQLFDGIVYEIHNPDEHACEPWFGARDYFLCQMHVYLDTMTIQAASHEGRL